ncbi:adenylosuccinate lyase [Physcia stellaris]|nr:adenylosuccinate lyase [Physcia stellaris]
MPKYDEYESPLAHRYASNEVKKIFSPRERASTWRKLWLWLAEAEKEVGLTQITDKAIGALRSNLIVSDEAFQVIAAEERIRRHDVMSAIFALEKDAPDAAGIIHIGATSCYGRRSAQWAQDLVMDLDDIEYARTGLRFRGAQGTTGTQASFMEIFQGDTSKIDRLNEILCEKAGFEACYDISTQTYSRKVDLRIANALSAFGATAIRIATDIRHLAHDKVLDEPHEATQVGTGSSAMAFKMNPMRSERICSLGRKLSNISTNFSDTFSSQWLERTLDDSAIRRIDIPEIFLLTDALLILLDDVTNGLVVFPAMIRSQIEQEIPFIATENIIVKLVHKGVSRQEAHERVRVLSLETVHAMKMEGSKNNLIERIKKDEFFEPILDDLDALLDPKLFIGRSAEIVERYLGADGPVTNTTLWAISARPVTVEL